MNNLINDTNTINNDIFQLTSNCKFPKISLYNNGLNISYYALQLNEINCDMILDFGESKKIKIHSIIWNLITNASKYIKFSNYNNLTLKNIKLFVHYLYMGLNIPLIIQMIQEDFEQFKIFYRLIEECNIRNFKLHIINLTIQIYGFIPMDKTELILNNIFETIFEYIDFSNPNQEPISTLVNNISTLFKKKIYKIKSLKNIELLGKDSTIYKFLSDVDNFTFIIEARNITHRTI